MITLILFQLLNEAHYKNSKNKAYTTEDDMPKIRLIEGHVRLRKDGRWEGRLFRDGKQHSIYEKTKIACIKKLTKYLKTKKENYKNLLQLKNGAKSG